MYENIEQFYKDNHHILIEDTSEGSLRPAKSVPKDGEAGIEKFKEFRNQSGRMSFLDNELQSILGELLANTITQNVRIMREMGFITETSNANNQKEYNFTSSFVNFVNSGEDTGCFILDRLHAISSLEDFTMYLNFLLCVLREAAIYGHIIAYPDADHKFRSIVVDAERRKFHRERVYNIYGFQSRGKRWDRDEYTPNVSYFCQAELKKLGLITKKSGEQVDGMDILTLTPSGHYLLKQICDNISNKFGSQILLSPSLNTCSSPLVNHENKIFFGAPGTGKSFEISQTLKQSIPYKQCRDKFVFRVTFHPEYDHASFLGGYKPYSKDGGNIEYKFVSQIFTNIFVKACNDPNNQYYLVIEEINRGNCAEIFGDLFQLLDRNKDYPINTSRELTEFLNGLDENGDKIIKNSTLFWDENGKMLLPDNITIWATMNTSDQSLMPMDSAFKRRWEWQYIPINYSEKNNRSATFEIEIGNKHFSWIKFIEAVNKKISNIETLGMDKCLGNYFVDVPEGKNVISEPVFKNKVLFYLWNDVFKDETDETIFKNANDQNKRTYADFFDEIKGSGYILDLMEGELKLTAIKDIQSEGGGTSKQDISVDNIESSNKLDDSQ